MGSRSPAMAARMILRATISTMGSLRSFSPSLSRAAENASPIGFKSSVPNELSAPRYRRSARRAPRTCAVLFLSRGFQQIARFPLRLATKIIQSIGKFVTARQVQPASLQIQKVLFDLWTSLRGSLARTVFRALQALADLLTQIIQHGVVLEPFSGGSTIGLSVTDA